MPPKSVNAFRVRDQVYVYLKNVTLDNGTKTNGYYPGVITAVRTEGAYAIRFDDGEAKDHVDKKWIVAKANFYVKDTRSNKIFIIAAPHYFKF